MYKSTLINQIPFILNLEEILLVFGFVILCLLFIKLFIFIKIMKALEAIIDIEMHLGEIARNSQYLANINPHLQLSENKNENETIQMSQR